MKNYTKKFIQTSLVAAVVLIATSPVYAIYDPEAQKDCTPNSTETVCLMRTTGPTPTNVVNAFNPQPVVQAIITSNLPLDLKVQLLKLIVSHLSQQIDTVKSNTYTYNGGTATLDNGRYSFNLGCNTISGTYTQTGSTISFAPGASTLMACAQDLMDKDTQLAKDLSVVDTITIKNGDVTLTGGKVKLELKKK